MSRSAWLLLSTTLAVRLLHAQLPLNATAQREFSGIFEESPKKATLDCQIETFKPLFDFSFRYEIGYIVRCPLKQFEGKETPLGSVLRIRPTSAAPVLLGQALVVPGIPDSKSGKVNFHKLHEVVELSGVFVTGEGDYSIELAVMDKRGRSYRKDWHVEAYAHGNESHAEAAMRPGTVSAVSLPNWGGLSSNGNGLRLTVLLDAAPLNPYSRRLRAWDQSFLLGSLSSLLRGVPLASVRLVAFNLDQQREIFRDESFDRLSMRSLAGELGKLELGTVRYTVLNRERGWAELLSKLVHTEMSQPHPSDAIVFLGPHERFDGNLDLYGRDKDAGPSDVPLFYLKYFPLIGADFPDAIQRFTNARNGTTFKLHSPGDLAQALMALQKKLRLPNGGG